jgi:glycosyltransferase involved in cell wall biosynthesis
MKRSRRIVVAGFAVGFPLGGQVWMMLHYLAGLTRLGHEVLFLEDTSNWAYPFDPVLGYPTSDSSRGRAVVTTLFARHGLAGRFAYVSQIEDRHYGLDRAELDRYLASADFFLNISGVLPLREEYFQAPVKAIIDTDPVFTQVKVASDAWTRDYYGLHDVCFTYGCNLPGGSTEVPLSGIDWKPLLPPVVLDLWPRGEGVGSGFTTIGTWDPRDRDVEVAGRKLSWKKNVKYEAMIGLPARVPQARLELTMSGMADDQARFAAAGWHVKNALDVSRDPEAYRDYIRGSMAEFTIAKDQNVVLGSGWFSDRTATYLAAGRPAVVEDTGYGRYLPVGQGLFPFADADGAVAAIEAVRADPARAGKAARAIAEAHFDSDIVLTGLLRECGLA